MSKMAADHNAINLSQGFPNFDIDQGLIELVANYMKKGYNQYAPMQGLPVLRQNISRKIKSLYDKDIDPDSEITISDGATEALFSTISAIIEKDDEVIVFEPAYDSYVPAITLNGGIPVYVSLKVPDFSIDWDEVKAKISDKTKLIIINTPNNPTGAILSKEDMQILSDIVDGTDILIISDEVYEHIVFDGYKHESILKYDTLKERGVAIFSFGKTFHATGWKMGYSVAPDWLTAEIRKVHQYVTFSVNTPVQWAIADYLEDATHYLGLGPFYQKKRDLFLKLTNDSRLDPIVSRGTYFQLFSYKGISLEADMEIAERITKDYGVASIPISVFYHNRTDHKYLRFCFAKKDETLERAADILCRI
ncbi:methionine aminotransferase [Fulvivirgaceae bacterium BMA10]|uniref:Methionine aminotransferase n=2 Tax=Splendidivirga corallicola TaxID=3051826 RepID=A0ABT8KMA1_9BACT|nr:methionine aminotransferase [Fulvivirgaceae bacterium BMA10]